MCEIAKNSGSWMDLLIDNVAENLGLKNARYELMSPDESFFVSSMFFVNIVANDDDTGKKRISVVVKRPPVNELLRTLMKMDAQFHNEILFYRKFAKSHKDLPRCIYADENPPTDSVMVLENISLQGYQLCPWRYHVPFDYIVAAIREIARFHTKGYAMKKRRRDEFFDFIWDLWEVRYNLDPDNSIMATVNSTSTRGIDFLRLRGYDVDFCDKVSEKFKNAYQTVMLPSLEHEEPFATLCHGDFTLNNIFFRKEKDKLQAMLIDFALLRYASPVIDLSSFLCLHCAEELDKDMLDNLLKVYHDTLKQCLAENGVDECEVYSYEALYEDYKRKGLFGYFIASFFLALSMGKTDMKPEEMVDLDRQIFLNELRIAGGDEVSEILANLLLRLSNIGCLDYLI